MARQSGFTIVEVMLFLAVSGVLFVLAFGMLNTAVKTTRFTDATNGLDNFLTQQYNDVRTGAFSRPNGMIDPLCSAVTPGTSDNCIIIGRLLDFQSMGSPGVNVVNTHIITARRCPDVAQPSESGCPAGAAGLTCPVADASEAARVASYCPRPLSSVQESYTLQWGVYMPPQVVVSTGAVKNPRARLGNGSAQPINRIAILHSPTSERVYTYVYSDTQPINGTPISQGVLIGNNLDRNVTMCLASPDLTGNDYRYVAIGAGQSSDFIVSGQPQDVSQMPGGLICS